jgi:hypothetical protein
MDMLSVRTIVANHEMYYCKVNKHDDGKFSGVVWDRDGKTIVETETFDIPDHVWDAMKCKLGSEFMRG